MTTGVLHLLETFPGWPEVDEPSNFYMFMLCIGAPLLLSLLFAVWILGGARRRELSAEERAISLDNDERPAVAGRMRRALPPTERAGQAHRGGATAAHQVESAAPTRAELSDEH